VLQIAFSGWEEQFYGSKMVIMFHFPDKG